MTPRLHRTFWALIVIAVISSGSLSTALAADPGPATALAVAGSAVLLAASGFLSLRILLATGQYARRDRPAHDLPASGPNCDDHCLLAVAPERATARGHGSSASRSVICPDDLDP